MNGPARLGIDAGRLVGSTQTYWEHFQHQADVGIRGVGGSPASAFEQAAMALTAIVTDPACVTPSRAVPVSCGNSNLDLLLVDWLNALIYEMSTRRMLFSRFEVHIDDQGHLDAYAWGEKIDTEKHKPAVEAKAATYFGLSVREEQPGRWVAQCVVDV